MANPNDYLNLTTSPDLSDEMKTYYNTRLIDYAEPELIHSQFGQKHSIPKGGGKKIEFRKTQPYPKALTPLTEGVTPEGRNLVITSIEAEVKQYGDYTALSDVADLTMIDPVISIATKNHGRQAGRTSDTIVREVLNSCQNVQYYDGSVMGRMFLEGGNPNKEDNDYLTVDCIRRAVRALKVQLAGKIDGNYVGIIHPDCAYDLMSDPEWQEPKKYCDPEDLYEGEIGRIAGCRFVETTEAKVFTADDLTDEKRTLTVASYSSNEVTIDEALSTEQAEALKGRKVIISGQLFTISGATNGEAGSAKFTIAETPLSTDNPADGDIIYPGEAGWNGRPVYSTLILGDDAYGVIDITGGGLEHIFKPLGSAGAADPLNQRCTTGWKMITTAKILNEQNIRRIETASTFESSAN